LKVALFFILSLMAVSADPNISQKIRNDKLTAYDVVLQPGEAASSGRPSVLVFFQAGSFEITPIGKPPEKVVVVRGETRFFEDNVWTNRNEGAAELHYALVLFVCPASQETWGKQGLAPNYTLLVENAYTRAYSIRIPAHTDEPQHTHHDRVVICLSGATLEHVYSDGRKEPSTLTTGEVTWRRGGTHIGQNLGYTDLWVVAVEPK
jgi:hypothetical protein